MVRQWGGPCVHVAVLCAQRTHVSETPLLPSVATPRQGPPNNTTQWRLWQGMRSVMRKPWGAQASKAASLKGAKSTSGNGAARAHRRCIPHWASLSPPGTSGRDAVRASALPPKECFTHVGALGTQDSNTHCCFAKAVDESACMLSPWHLRVAWGDPPPEPRRTTTQTFTAQLSDHNNRPSNNGLGNCACALGVVNNPRTQCDDTPQELW